MWSAIGEPLILATGFTVARLPGSPALSLHHQLCRDAGHGLQSFSAQAHMSGSMEQALACGLVSRRLKPNHKWVLIGYPHMLVCMKHAADKFLRCGNI